MTWHCVYAVEFLKSLLETRNWTNIEVDKQLNFFFKREKKVIELIKRLEKEGKISEKEYELIYARGSRPGILYGSPKFHKPVITNCPKFRPILSMIGTPTYKLAKFLVSILLPITSNEFSVHDLFSFADEVSSFCLTISWPVLMSKVFYQCCFKWGYWHLYWWLVLWYQHYS